MYRRGNLPQPDLPLRQEEILSRPAGICVETRRRFLHGCTAGRPPSPVPLAGGQLSGAGILEHEYTDSKTYISDSEKIEAFFNDIRENPEFKPSFLGKLLIANTEQNRAFTLQLKKHLEVLNKIGEALDKLQKKI